MTEIEHGKLVDGFAAAPEAEAEAPKRRARQPRAMDQQPRFDIVAYLGLSETMTRQQAKYHGEELAQIEAVNMAERAAREKLPATVLVMEDENVLYVAKVRPDEGFAVDHGYPRRQQA
jgi:uncharacterized iron-regulated membrane protein